MYKNFNGSSDYSKNVFESYKNKLSEAQVKALKQRFKLQYQRIVAAQLRARKAGNENLVDRLEKQKDKLEDAYNKKVGEITMNRLTIKDKKQINTKFNKDKQAYNSSSRENREINKKDVDLDKVKVDRDTSMRTSNRVVPGTIKLIEKGLIVLILSCVGMYIWNMIMTYHLLIPSMILTAVIVGCAYSIVKGINKVKKLFRR
jgi:hypothetical protein